VVKYEKESLSITCCRVLQHLQITVRVSKSGNRASANELMDSNGLSFFVVNEV
jgi:hypothetical protein